MLALVGHWRGVAASDVNDADADAVPLPELKPCIMTCRAGMCLYDGCSNGPLCPGGSCLFRKCKNAQCSGGACTFQECSGPATTCDGGGCKFFNHQDTLGKGYCSGEGCQYNNRPHPTFHGGYLST